jgi:uncharacterized membrane protein
MIVPLLTLAICYAIFFVYIAVSYGSLPSHLATHFDMEGQPNGWMSRNQCVEFTIGLGVLMPAFIIAIMSGAGKIPVSFVNLPHREYWLEPQRRQETLGILTHYALWFACMNVLFVTGLHWLIVQANSPGQTPHLNGWGIAILAGAFLAGTGVWVRLLVRHFSKIQ